MKPSHNSRRYVLLFSVLSLAILWPGMRSGATTKDVSVASPTQPAPAQQPASLAQPSPTPNPYLMDGEAGPCSVEFKLSDASGKPVSAALISVHLAYGFGGFHKLDMSVYSSPEGKAKFIGIPAKVKNAPLQFRAVKDQLVGVASLNPASECHAQHDIVMDSPKSK
jgi:hypothetical protein